MKELKWNMGILTINLGYKVRFYEQEPKGSKLRWNIGVFILRLCYKLRGDIPNKTWKLVHI